MTAILRYESTKRVRESLVLTAVFAVLSLFLFAAFPGFADSAELLEEAFPDVLIGIFGFEAMHTIEGFVAGYTFPMVWVLFTGIYFAYTSAGMIAGEIRDRKIDLTLSNPVSRESVILQKVAALWVPLLVLNVGLYLVLYFGVMLVGESFDPVVLALAHLLSIPYLLVCAGIGLVLTVTVDRTETAEAAALGLVFVLWLVEGLAEMSPEYDWVGALTPRGYYDPGAILIHEEYALWDAGILLAVFGVLLGIALTIFVRRDI